MQGSDRNIQLICTGIFQCQIFSGYTTCINSLQANITADAMIKVYDGLSNGEFSEITNNGFIVGRGFFISATTLYNLLTKQVIFTNQSHIGFGQNEAMLQRADDDPILHFAMGKFVK